MAQGLLTPLQLTAGSALLNNTGIVLATAMDSALDGFDNTSVVTAWQAAVDYYLAQSWKTTNTLALLLSIGNSSCAALGNSIPTGAPTPRPITGPVSTGFSGLLRDTGELYLGDGSVARFTQGFMAVQNYLATTNIFINSATNAQTYLGPTFTNLDNLTTNNISSINSNFSAFGIDLGNQGLLTNFQDIDIYGTPAALLRQVAEVADLQGGTLTVIETPMLALGATKANIQTLVTGSRADDPIKFDQLQKIAYNAMTQVTGDGLQQVLSILEVKTPNILTMADLLDPKKIFPNSWQTMATPTPSGPIPVYKDDGSVNMFLAETVNNYLPTVSGCEELGKIIPPGLAVANKSVQLAYQQITGLYNTTLPKLAETVLGQCNVTWSNNSYYLANSCVANGAPIPTFYRAQQDVPPGIDINNTDYWLPTTLGGLSTMAGLPDLQAQTEVLPESAISYYSNELAVGTGPDNTVTICDVIGAAIGSGYTAQLTQSTEAINTMDTAGELDALKAIYADMLTATNDSEMLGYISDANTEISSIVAANPTETAVLNTAFDAMADKLATEKSFQDKGGIDYADFSSTNKNSVYAFIQNLGYYGSQVDACGAAYYLIQIADTSIIGGQALIGAMREAQNNQRLQAGQIDLDTAPNSSLPVTPVPVVVPVN